MRIFWLLFLAGGLSTAAIRQAQPPIPPFVPPPLPTDQTEWGYIVHVLHTNVAYQTTTMVRGTNAVTITNSISLITTTTPREIGFRNDHVVVWRAVELPK